jgi:hypothetical protein
VAGERDMGSALCTGGVKKMSGRPRWNPPCEYCGSHKYTYDELIFVCDDEEERKKEYRGLYICPDCVFDSIIR